MSWVRRDCRDRALRRRNKRGLAQQRRRANYFIGRASGVAFKSDRTARRHEGAVGGIAAAKQRLPRAKQARFAGKNQGTQGLRLHRVEKWNALQNFGVVVRSHAFSMQRMRLGYIRL
jgi:hypothetical protein